MKPKQIRGVHREQLWQRLADTWAVGAGYWHPLAEVPRRDVLAFQAPDFHQALVAGQKLHAILAGRGVERVFEVREGGSAYQIELSDLDPTYTGDEGFWCSDAMDWLLYASHESSLTVGGKWLISRVKAAWPEWERHVWTTPML
ncbi:hypothetical protein [Longimicrobium sp.]|uniref:hypothetical protein n=1 Tax=Longimicrobium sp. TaxID=2029185 RepID=UPI002EDAEC50